MRDPAKIEAELRFAADNGCDYTLLLEAADALALLNETAGAAPVAHGEWLPVYFHNKPMYYYCSECELRVMKPDGINYCSNCGAKMEKEKQNEC